MSERLNQVFKFFFVGFNVQHKNGQKKVRRFVLICTNQVVLLQAVYKKLN